MSFGIHDAYVPPVLRVLDTANRIVGKAEAHTLANGLDPQALVGSRLYGDMYAFDRQIEELTDHAVTGAANLAGQAGPDLGAVPATFDAMRQRIALARDFVAGLAPSALNGTEAKLIRLVFPAMTMEFTGATYVTEFVLPSIMFHAVTGYGIMRSRGVVLGKLDFLGDYPAVADARAVAG